MHRYNPAECDTRGERTKNLGAEILTAARVLTAADDGKTFFLDLVGGFDITLPANQTAGFSAKFIVRTAPTTAYTITAATVDTIVGTVVTAATGAADTEATLGGDVINFVASTAVLGDRVEINCDGQYWYCVGVCSVAGGITITG